MKALIRTLGHLLAAAAPAIAGAVATAIAQTLNSTHQPTYVAIGTMLGTIVPLLRNVGDDDTVVQNLVNAGNPLQP